MVAAIIPARLSDVDKIVALMGSLSRASTYKGDDTEYVTAMVSGEKTPIGAGKVFVAIGFDGRLAGYAIARKPDGPTNLGIDIGLIESDLAKVAHMEHVAVHPAWQGCGLGMRLLAAIETPGILLATVHPDNHASLYMFERSGYVPVWEGLKYGGQPRLIVRKNRLEDES